MEKSKLLGLVNPTGAVAGTLVDAHAGRIGANSDIKAAGAKLTSAHATAIEGLASICSDPDEAFRLVIESQAKATEADTAVAHGKNKRALIYTGGALALAGLVAGSALYVFRTTNNDAKAIARGIEKIATRAMPEPYFKSLSDASEENVELKGTTEFISAFDKATSNLDIVVESCLPFVGCAAVPGESSTYTTVAYKNEQGLITGGGITLSSGHTGDGQRAQDYYPIAYVNPNNLDAQTADPSDQDYVDNNVAPNIQAAANVDEAIYSPNPGRVTGLGVGLDTALGINTHQGAPATITLNNAISRINESCTTTLNPTIPAGVVRIVHNQMNQAINLLEGRKTVAAAEQAEMLKIEEKNPVHIVYRATEIDPTLVDRNETVYSEPSTVHLQANAGVADKAITVNHSVAGIKVSATKYDLSSTENGTCSVTPNALRQLEAITEQHDYVFDPIPVGAQIAS